VLKFGTDGVRGEAFTELTAELVTALGRAAARVLPGDTFVVGRDTRESGPRLEAALVAGIVAEGASARLLGVAPTPAVAWVAAADGALGAVISASHNPYRDNGVKFFGPGGRKLTDEQEYAVETELRRILDDHASTRATGQGDVVDASADLARWADAVAGSIGGRRLDGLRVVVDCANGASSAVSPAVLESLGAHVHVLHAEPDGTNINHGCGSNHPEELRRVVVSDGADVGIAFDGDADRVVAVDGDGELVDGDQLLAIAAIDLAARGVLTDRSVVVTVMTNLGFRQGMARHGIDVVEVPVGDRHVLAALADRHLSLGGEQSGHLVFADLATTGDGLLAAVQVLDLLCRSGRSLDDLVAEAMTRLPQVLRNVAAPVGGGDVVARLAPEVAAVEAELGGGGRVLLRPSGTEPLVRVMVEAPTQAQAEAVADRLAAAVTRLT
jgi:phosphoglucosamine mutase